MEFRKAQALVFDCQLIGITAQMKEIRIPLYVYCMYFEGISATELNEQFEHWN